jgi:hypothetical protein
MRSYGNDWEECCCVDGISIIEKMNFSRTNLFPIYPSISLN